MNVQRTNPDTVYPLTANWTDDWGAVPLKPRNISAYDPTPKSIFARNVISWLAAGTAMVFMTYYTLNRMIPFLEGTLEYTMAKIDACWFLLILVPIAGFGGKRIGDWLGFPFQLLIQKISACQNQKIDQLLSNA